MDDMSFDEVLLWLFFFFKQKTAYEMRISDWSSDVCSSDLWGPSRCTSARTGAMSTRGARSGSCSRHIVRSRRPMVSTDGDTRSNGSVSQAGNVSTRSEERRVGKEGGGQCRSRW